MESIDRDVLIALASGLLGTLAGALLQGLGSAFQSYREDKRTLKQLLFNQLDLWIELKSTDLNAFLPLILEHLERALLARGAPKEFVDNMLEGAMPWATLIFRSVELGNPVKVLPRYRESVNELALAGSP